MGLIPEDKIAEIRDRTDIVSVVGEYVQLKRTGVNHKGLCPFHNEKSPSFNVNQQKQFFHCFGCGKSGDVYTFLTEIEGKPFVEVARELAKRAGVEIPEAPRSREQQERARAEESERARMVRLNELVANWFRAQLDEPHGERARAYVEKRGIGQAVRDTFRVGFAPAGWDALTRFLESKKVPHELAERAGLIRRRDSARMQPGAPPSKATHFDVFVDRVVYALTSPMGEPIGFGGRVLEGAPDDQPKYKNSPETLLYKKGENLFGLHVAKHAIRKTGRALVVEGNFDVMTLHERGVQYAVAPQGTALTDAQVALLKRFAREVVLMLDADPAGRAATMRVIRSFVEADLACRVAQLRAKDGKKVDPDDLARNDLPRLQQMIETAVDAVEFFFDQVASTSAPTVPGRVAAIDECAPLLRMIADPVKRGLYGDRLAELLRVDRGFIVQRLRGAAPRERAPQPSAHPNAPEANGLTNPATGAANGLTNPQPVARRPIDPTHAKLLAFLAQHATLIAHMTPEAIAAISDADVRTLVERAVAAGAFDAKQALAECAPAIRDEVARALLSDEFAPREDDDALKQQRVLADITLRIRLQQDVASLEAQRRAAIDSNDRELVERLTAQIRLMYMQRKRPGEASR